jgi:hypothetical protein
MFFRISVSSQYSPLCHSTEECNLNSRGKEYKCVVCVRGSEIAENTKKRNSHIKFQHKKFAAIKLWCNYKYVSHVYEGIILLRKVDTCCYILTREMRIQQQLQENVYVNYGRV